MSVNVFNNLFIFEIANNHQGNPRHGLNLIRALGEVAARENIKAAVKFQFRHLETFLSPSHRENPNPLARRFLSTELGVPDFELLLQAVKDEKMLSMCTPFDEHSADKVKSMGFDFIKVASCSATDLPLLKKISQLNIPTVASTAGLKLTQVDELVNLLESSNTPLALMHCIALYPSENHELRLDRIAELRARYPQHNIGFSTHERPDNLLAIQLAYAQGARLFEKHVGLPTDEVKLNAYSASPAQLTTWIQAWKSARAACESTAPSDCLDREASALRKLKRACFAAERIKKGEKLGPQNISFALAFSPNQLLVEDFREGLISQKNYEAGEPVFQEDILDPLLQQLKQLLQLAGVEIFGKSSVEVSHHYGMKNFRENGVFILFPDDSTLKKILVLLPGQIHPNHFHRQKSETFRVLNGSLDLEVDGKIFHLKRGEQILIPKQSWHRFSSIDGAVVEETSDLPSEDSFYEDKSIQNLARNERKTIIPFA